MGSRAGASSDIVALKRRMILDLTAAGWTEREIAKAVDRSIRHVQRVRTEARRKRALERAALIQGSADARIFSKLLRRG